MAATAERRVAIVTGGGRGLGLAMALGLAKSGVDTVVTDIDDEPFEAVKASAPKGAGAGRLHCVKADITQEVQVDAAVQETVDVFGRVDILVNNAGLNMTRYRADADVNPDPFWKIPPDTYRKFFELHVMAPYLLSRSVLPHMQAGNWGRIVTVTTSLSTMLRKGGVPYGSTKAACEAQMSSFAGDLDGEPVTVNIIVPGAKADTRLVPATGLDRATLLPPDAMVAPLLYLVSEQAASITRHRVVAAWWDPEKSPEENLEHAGAPIGWPGLQAVPTEADKVLGGRTH